MPQSKSVRALAKQSAAPAACRWPLLICVGLLIVFGASSWFAAHGKSATYDEPLHGVGTYVLSQLDDYRANPEDPPLWQWWASIPLTRDSLHPNVHTPLYNSIFGSEGARWPWVFSALYLTPGVEAEGFITSIRTMLLILGVALGAVIAWWSWRLGGAVAAVAATTLFAFDPNFLAHASMIKNDVAISLVGTALAFATWHAGKGLTLRSILLVAFLGGAAVVTKFSGPLLLIACAATFAVRAMLPWPWRVGRWEARTFLTRAAAAGVLMVVTAVVAYVMIWGCYRFRFSPARDGSLWDFAPSLQRAALSDLTAEHPDKPAITKAELDTWRPPVLVRTISFCNKHHLLPQTWLYGLLFVYRASRIRIAFLLGKTSLVGFRWYFPLAFLFKTPLASLVAIGAAGAVGGLALRARRRQSQSSPGAKPLAPTLWSIACVVVPFLIVGTADLRANLNIGVRHILPLYPFIYIGVGCAAAWAWRRWGASGNLRVILAGLAVALVIESVTTFPDYLSFFNRASGGARGGLGLLGDSNLDWGQDLPLLADWQKRNPDRKLYLFYFGIVDPAYYKIRYSPLPGYQNYRPDFQPATEMPTEPGVIAISANYLQGYGLPEGLQRAYAELRDHQVPLEVLGGSIYLYEYNP